MKKHFIYLMGLLYVVAGANHFAHTDFYIRMIPPYIPAPYVMVFWSGLAEIFLGIAVMLPLFRKWAAYGIISLLLAVFPANIYMATHAALFHLSPMGLWLRLPIQLVLIYWAYRVSITTPPEPTAPAFP